jgi:hypothetical protein
LIGSIEFEITTFSISSTNIGKKSICPLLANKCETAHAAAFPLANHSNLLI